MAGHEVASSLPVRGARGLRSAGGSSARKQVPKLDEIAIIPTDRNKNGQFDMMALVASPYVAGPWVEGSYEIGLAVTSELLAALKADYRASFEAQAQ
jgi:hypothetical protein